jgi:transcriptional regulator with XRE-family HTH domain
VIADLCPLETEKPKGKTIMLMKTKKPNPIDVQVGARIRLARNMLNMSQEKLGEGLGITFQQIQKYEKGTNRVGASRLSNIATILQQPVSWFFEDLPAAPQGEPDEITALLQSPEGIKLVRGYSRLKTPAYRDAVLRTIDTLAKAERGEA